MTEQPPPAGAVCAVHPEHPAVQVCPRCGSFACAECLREALPEEPLCAACRAREPVSPLPWDHRAELGVVRAWFKTVPAVMLRPGLTFSSARTRGDTTGSLLFSAIASLLGTFTTGVGFVVFSFWMPLPPGPGSEGMRTTIISSYAVLTLLAPFLGMAANAVSALIDHVVMVMLGKPRPFEVTLRAASLSLAPSVLGVIPLCSMYVAPFWILVARVFAYKRMHRTTTGVALAGALLAPSLAFFLCIGFYAIVFFALMSNVFPAGRP